MQKNRNPLEAALLLLPFIVVALIWPRLPAIVPLHWNLRGEIDGWGSRPWVLLLPAMALGLNLLLRVLPLLDPKLRRQTEEATLIARVLQKFRLALSVFFLLLFGVQIAASFGYSIGTGRFFNSCVLLGLAVLGNYLGNLRPNYFAGIRTPWTLESPETWRATHRLGARLMVFGAIALIFVQFFVSASVFGLLFLVALLALLVWSFLYSWRYFQTHAPTK
jgi:uncharacterized membrane protein